MHGDRCNPSLPHLPSVCYPPHIVLNSDESPSRLWTQAALQSAFMLVDFRRFWCHNEGGWCFDMVPWEFHAPCVSNGLRCSAGRYSRNRSFIASAWGDYQLPLRQGWSRQHQAPSLSPAFKLHFSRHLIWKCSSNPTNLLQIQWNPGWYTIYYPRGLFKYLIDSLCHREMKYFGTEKQSEVFLEAKRYTIFQLWNILECPLCSGTIKERQTRKLHKKTVFC